ncbi:hypothetical protein ABB26_17620 [Stenotrophomonas humi]|uniref:Uncharacterized protein n=1 Tax=Stenotrophomonas humi TaxID=405444 RepID=A0A0R0BXM7_9GAMM|nr:hypothetical protein ABB26_17620 [Stenotrophomonas humi]
MVTETSEHRLLQEANASRVSNVIRAQCTESELFLSPCAWAGCLSGRHTAACEHATWEIRQQLLIDIDALMKKVTDSCCCLLQCPRFKTSPLAGF